MTVVDDIQETPDTWDSAAGITVSQIFSFNLPAGNKLEDMRAQLDCMISQNIGISPEDSVSSREMSNFWKLLALMTRAAASASEIAFFGINTERAPDKEKLEKLINEVSGLIIRKQRDYGSDNIMRFGRLGLLVRVHDKIARLENLAARGTKPNNESIVDNYLDVIGYCTVAIMFERGWFTLPLQELK